MAALASALQGPTRLTLAYDGIGDTEAKALAGALRTNTALTWISLDGNDIGVEGAKALAGALLTNDTVTTIDLRSNTISGEIRNQINEATAANETKIGKWVMNGNVCSVVLKHVFATYGCDLVDC